MATVNYILDKNIKKYVLKLEINTLLFQVEEMVVKNTGIQSMLELIKST